MNKQSGSGVTTEATGKEQSCLGFASEATRGTSPDLERIPDDATDLREWLTGSRCGFSRIGHAHPPAPS